MRKMFSTLLLAAFALLLSGCAAGPGMRTLKDALNDEGDPQQTRAVVYSMVSADEQFIDKHSLRWRNAAYLNNLPYGSPRRAYRITPMVAFRYTNLRALYHSNAYVPDYLPLLRDGDVVEVSQKGVADQLTAAPEEGRDSSVVVRVVCFKGAPDYEQCWKSYGVAMSSAIQGASHLAHPVEGAPFIEGPERYGLTFTPRYDVATGEVLPTAKPLPPRESFYTQALSKTP